MEDFDYNQIQQNQLHDVADDTMMPDGAENRADHDNENVVHIVNGSEWTEQQQHKVVDIDTEERRRGKGFMQRVKQRWEAEYPTNPTTVQNCRDV